MAKRTRPCSRCGFGPGQRFRCLGCRRLISPYCGCRSPASARRCLGCGDPAGAARMDRARAFLDRLSGG